MNDWTFIQNGHEWTEYRDKCMKAYGRGARHSVINGRMNNEPASYPFMVYTDVHERDNSADDMNHYLMYVDEVGPLMDSYISNIVEQEILE